MTFPQGQTLKYEIVQSGDYLHVVCPVCREGCRFSFKGYDPSIPLIEITCSYCGSSGNSSTTLRWIVVAGNASWAIRLC